MAERAAEEARIEGLVWRGTEQQYRTAMVAVARITFDLRSAYNFIGEYAEIKTSLGETGSMPDGTTPTHEAAARAVLALETELCTNIEGDEELRQLHGNDPELMRKSLFISGVVVKVAGSVLEQLTEGF